MKLGLLQYQIGRYVSFPAWEAALDARIHEAASHGADLLILPEYATLDSIPAPLPTVAAERDAAADSHAAILQALTRAAARHQVWLLGGSLLVRRGAAVVNTAPLISPDGHTAFQDKHRTTRFESDTVGPRPPAHRPTCSRPPGAASGFASATTSSTRPLARAQIEAGAWLILVPTDTDTLAGFNRVRLAARACALSNQCYVAVATTVGDAPWIAALDTNRGYAAIFGPIDQGFPDDGVIARGPMDEPGWLYAELDPAPLLAIRETGAVRNHHDYPAAPPPCPILQCR